MAAVLTNDAPSALQLWRLDTGDRADCIVALRDYCRRLGFTATLEGPTLVEVEADVDRGEIGAFVESWAKANGVEVSLEPAPGAHPAVSQPLAIVPPKSAAAPPRLGDLLIRKGFITEEQLASALVEARASGLLLGVTLLRDRVIFEDELARTLSEQLELPYVSILRIGVDAKAVSLLPQEVGDAVAAIPTRRKDSVVQVAFADPTDARALSEVRAYIPEIEPAVAELSDIRLAWREFVRRYQT